MCHFTMPVRSSAIICFSMRVTVSKIILSHPSRYFFNFHAQKKGQCLVGKEFYRLPAHDYFVSFFSRFSEHHLYNYRPSEIPLGPVTIFSCPELNDSWAVVTREFKFQFMHRPYNKSWMNDAGDVTHLEALRVKNFAARTLCSTTHTTIHSY